MKDKNIIWIGNTYEKSTFKKNLAISAAANAWQLNVIENLKLHGFKVVQFSYYQEQLWPKGNLISNFKLDAKSSDDQITINYLNIPFFKDWIIYFILRNKIQLFLKERKHYYNVVSYNADRINVLLCKSLVKLNKFNWYNIWADTYYPGKKFKKNVHVGVENAHGHIFLSFHGYKIAPYQNKIHFEGLVREKIKKYIPRKRSDKITLMYAGSFTKWSGIDNFIRLFNSYKSNNVTLLVCGHGQIKKETYKLILSDHRIIFLGTVDKDTLETNFRNTDVFINPRNDKTTDNYMNFPSKIFDYLPYGKPILSSKTLGLSPEYEKILKYTNFYDLNSFSSQLEKIMNWNEVDWQKHHHDTRIFIEKKSSEKIGRKLSNFIKES
tara:strand:+ start:14053 stop:15192 length:1140 start_codon:yes stop_codon:yes gene_type:complete